MMASLRQRVIKLAKDRPGRPMTIYGPVALAKSIELPITMIARKILTALPDDVA